MKLESMLRLSRYFAAGQLTTRYLAWLFYDRGQSIPYFFESQYESLMSHFISNWFLGQMAWWLLSPLEPKFN